ncbi:hypothetical protein BGX27_001322 [Mortierella sp. AM989]|nr:hypothetical protein BGX27_001322 [Mortierella sp. AM989]
MLRGLIDEQFWRDIYINQTPSWSLDAQVNHLPGGETSWRRMVTSDYLRRNWRWVDKPLSDPTNHTQLVDVKKRLRIDLGSANHYKPQHMLSANCSPSNEPSRWRNVGSPALYTDPATGTTIAAYMQARSYEGRSDHQIAVYGLPNHETPIAIIPSSFWAHRDADMQLEPELATENLGPAQLMDMKHFPETPGPNGRIRVVFVVAFGERNQAPADSEDRDLYIVDIWSLLRIVEVYIAPPSLSVAIPDVLVPIKGRVETIAPRSRQEVIRIRIARIYSALNQATGLYEDRIALFGIHQGSRLRTVLMTSPLLAATPQLLSDGVKGQSSSIRPSSWECHVLGGMQALEPSCIALFPAQSDFDCLLVIMDQRGNGEIWDWMRRVRVSVLRMSADGSQDERSHRSNLYYWGVHINWAIEEPGNNGNGKESSALPFNLGSSRRKHGDFRVVAMADGNGTEWESSWWNIDEKQLRERLNPSNETWIIDSLSRHFERCTRGSTYPLPQSYNESVTCQLPGAGDNSLMFIAYLIWDHYRIALTAQYGICIFDMDKELPGDILSEDQSRPPHWVTMIEGAHDDPLIDIATVGNCLFLTRKHSHMVWVF